MARSKSKRPREVFLSHSSRDRKFADKLSDTLRRHGISVWYSDTNIIGAQQWHDEIGKALSRCDWFLLVLSPAALKSRWVKRELFFALEDSRYDNRIVPLMFRKCDLRKLSWTLSGMEQVDCSTSHQDGFTELLRVWGKKFQPK